MGTSENKNNRPHTYSEVLNGKNPRADLRLSLALMSAEAHNRALAKTSTDQLNEPPISSPRILIPKKTLFAVKSGNKQRAVTPGRDRQKRV